MPDTLDQPLTEFRTDLERLSQLIELIRSIKAFGAVSEGEGGTDAFTQTAQQLRDRIRALSADLPVLSGTLLLYLAGRFEHFVRMSFEELCDAYAAKCTVFDELPNKMRESLRLYTAEVALSPRKFGYDTVEASGFLVTYAANVSATAGLGSINSDCLSITQNNLRPDTLGDLYKRIGVSGIWADISKQAPLKTFFGTASDEDTERQARAKLDELMALRNQIAHPSASPTFPDPDKVSAFLSFVLTLAENLTVVARMHLAAFAPAPSPAPTAP